MMMIVHAETVLLCEVVTMREIEYDWDYPHAV